MTMAPIAPGPSEPAGREKKAQGSGNGAQMGRAARITPHPACPQPSGHTPVADLPALAMSHVITQPRCGPVHLWAGGCSRPTPPQPVPSNKDSCHEASRWCPAFLLTLTLGELLCLWQDHISASACCQVRSHEPGKALMLPVEGAPSTHCPGEPYLHTGQSSFQGRYLP